MLEPTDAERAEVARYELWRINRIERGQVRCTDDGTVWTAVFFWQPQEGPGEATCKKQR